MTGESAAPAGEPVVLYAEFTALPEAVAEVAALIADYAVVVRAEPGNQRFEVYQRKDNPAHFVVFEIYRDRAAFDVHLGGAQGAEFNAALGPLIQGDGSTLTFLTP